MKLFAALFLTWSLLSASCHDPITERAIAALGPEVAGIPPGPLHRPNQPCVLCHATGGTAAAFAVGGTVYRDPEGRAPLAGVTVVLADRAGGRQQAITNCAGNFFIRSDEWRLRSPVWTTLVGGSQLIDMESPIYREGSCAACHGDPAGPASAGHVFLTDDPLAAIDLPPDPSCEAAR